MANYIEDLQEKFVNYIKGVKHDCKVEYKEEILEFFDKLKHEVKFTFMSNDVETFKFNNSNNNTDQKL